MEVMIDQGGSYESLTGDVLNSSTEEWEAWINFAACSEDVPQAARAQQAPQIETLTALTYSPRNSLVANSKSKKKVLRETSPKIQQRDESSTKNLEDAPESQVQNGTAMVFLSESCPKPSNPKGRVLLRPNLPDLSYGEQ